MAETIFCLTIWPLLIFLLHIHFSEVFHQQAVDEDISATDAAQEDQVNAVVEEGDELPREEVVAGKDEAEGVVLENSQAPIP